MIVEIPDTRKVSVNCRPWRPSLWRDHLFSALFFLEKGGRPVTNLPIEKDLSMVAFARTLYSCKWNRQYSNLKRGKKYWITRRNMNMFTISKTLIKLNIQFFFFFIFAWTTIAGIPYWSRGKTSSTDNNGNVCQSFKIGSQTP